MPPNVSLPSFELPGAVQSLLAVVLFFTPGFVAGKVFGLFFQRRDDSEKVRLLEYIALSCVNYAIWSWLLLLCWRGNLWESHPFLLLAGFLVVLLVSPVVLGGILAFVVDRAFVVQVGRYIGIRTPHPIGTAWEWFFRHRLRHPWWVIIRLKSGIIVYGFFGEHSYMGNERGASDLYLEAECKLNSEGKLELIRDTAGVYIKYEDIEAVAFKWVDRRPGISQGEHNDTPDSHEPQQ